MRYETKLYRQNARNISELIDITINIIYLYIKTHTFIISY